MPLSFEMENYLTRLEAQRTHTPLGQAARHPCATCPWWEKFVNGRARNRCFPDPSASISRAWQGYREQDGGAKDGLVVECHMGVHSETPPAEQKFSELRPCAAALAVQQREMVRFYLGEPNAIDNEAAVRIARRAGIDVEGFIARKLTKAELIKQCHPAVADARLRHPMVAPIKPGEFENEDAA
jgi:hypothetical protein